MDPANDIFYSVVGSWELVTKKAKKKFAFPEHFFETLERQGFECLPITLSHTLVLRDLPNLHGDPFDRMLVAQAKSEHMTLITRDAGLAEYGVKCVLA